MSNKFPLFKLPEEVIIRILLLTPKLEDLKTTNKYIKDSIKYLFDFYYNKFNKINRNWRGNILVCVKMP